MRLGTQVHQVECEEVGVFLPNQEKGSPRAVRSSTHCCGNDGYRAAISAIGPGVAFPAMAARCIEPRCRFSKYSGRFQVTGAPTVTGQVIAAEVRPPARSSSHRVLT